MPLIRTIAAGFALVAVLGSVWAAAGAPPAQPPYRIVQRGSVMLPQKAIDREGQEVKIAGLSGITWLGDDRYAAIMDNSDKLLLFKLTLARDGTPEEASNLEIVTLAEHHDYEDVAICPESLQQRIAARRIKQGFPDPGPCLLVCEENTPAIRAISIADGSLLGVIPIPKVFETRRPNRGFESLDIDADGRHIWTANEEALSADGPAATAASGTVVRIAHIAIPEPGQQQREEPIQLAYAVDPPHQFLRIFTGEPLSGVAAITGLGDGRLLVLERSGCPGLPPFENRIYLVDWREATDVSGVEQGLAERTEAHIGKTLLWKDQLGINVEGLCLGPKLAGGNRGLLAIADNNCIGTPNQVVAFVLEESSQHTSVPLMIGAAAVAFVILAVLVRRITR